MGKAARRRRRHESGDGQEFSGGHGEDARAAGSSAVIRLARKNRPGRMTLATAYAHGLAQMASADPSGTEEETWPAYLDPLEAVFAGAAPDSRFRNGHEVGNMCAVWLRRLRGTAHWPDIDRFVAEIIALSQEHGLPVNHPDLMVLAAGRLEAAGLDQRKFPASLTPDGIPDDSRMIRGPRGDVTLPEPPADVDERTARFWASAEVELEPDGTPVDCLRHGFYRLEQAGFAAGPRFGPGALQTALFAGVTGLGVEDLERLMTAALLWNHALPEDSVLVPVADAIRTAAEENLSANDALGRLFGIPEFTEAHVSAADRRYHGLLGTTFAYLAMDLGYPQVNLVGVGKVVPSDPLGDAAERVRQKIAQENPADLPELHPSKEESRETVAGLLESLGTHPAWAYAHRRTGILPEFDGTFASTSDEKRWNGAVTEYLRKHDPDEEIDTVTCLESLQALLVSPVLIMASNDAEYAAGLSHRLDDVSAEQDPDVIRLKLYLARNEDYVLRKVRSDDAVLKQACEFARAWDGAEFAERVREAAAGTAPGEVPVRSLFALTMAASVASSESA